MPHNAPSIPGIWSTRSFDQVNPPVAVLIVDDDSANADALAAAFTFDGFRTQRCGEWPCSAYDAPGLGTACRYSRYRNAVCDGFAVAEAMRGSRRFAAVPIIAFTSLDESEVIERGKEVQIDAYCRKGNSLHSRTFRIARSQRK